MGIIEIIDRVLKRAFKTLKITFKTTFFLYSLINGNNLFIIFFIFIFRVNGTFFNRSTIAPSYLFLMPILHLAVLK